ncbi:CENP-B protein 2 [Sugiyamaella lignohabitans]|uniref:CENP-B protein 2 n=1 Tax=Sugiyamaella lignohabitans TaxID=796027 RepID=A0A167E511_9ASCO|nr:CENP-B protein 2 [Sugiyamaella lignohabitans]ANB13648.1 CENP-B protein 2 [Sugiyamaella lignohabitans]
MPRQVPIRTKAGKKDAKLASHEAIDETLIENNVQDDTYEIQTVADANVGDPSHVNQDDIDIPQSGHDNGSVSIEQHGTQEDGIKFEHANNHEADAMSVDGNADADSNDKVNAAAVAAAEEEARADAATAAALSSHINGTSEDGDNVYDSSPGPSGKGTKRAGFTNREKKALREWASMQDPKPSQKQCIDWFYQKFNRRISQSGVSRCLSEKNKHLDEGVINDTSIRNRYGKYPVLEDMLVDWQLYQSKTGGAITAALLLKKARELWYRIPEYRDLEPEFNYRWLDRFRKRNNIEYTAGRTTTNVSVASAEGDASSRRSLTGVQKPIVNNSLKKRASNVIDNLAEATGEDTASTTAGIASSVTTTVLPPLSADPSIANTDPALFDSLAEGSATSSTTTGIPGGQPTFEGDIENTRSFTDPESAIESLRDLQVLCSTYDQSNIYTVMETGFYWRKSLSASSSIPSLLPRHPLSGFSGRNGDTDGSDATHGDVDAATAAAVALAAATAAAGGIQNSTQSSSNDHNGESSSAIQDDDINPELAAMQHAAAAVAVANATGVTSPESTSVADHTSAQEVARSVLAQQNHHGHNNHDQLVGQVDESTAGARLNPDAKSEKFTVLISSNCSGSDRIPLHIVSPDKPRSLHNVNLAALGATWITRRVPGLDVFTMRKWLTDFIAHIREKFGSRSKRYLLILYRNAVHEDAVKLVNFPENIRVEFINQRDHESGGLPLEQEIVQRWKLNYSYHWLKYVLDSLNGAHGVEQDPVETVRVSDCIQWAVQSWYHEISNGVFRNAFLSSALCRVVSQLEPVEALPNIDLLYQAIKHTGHIPDILDVDSFLNSDFELPDIVEDNEGDLLDAIVERRLGRGKNNVATEPTFASLIEDSAEIDDTPSDILSVEQASQYMNELIRWAVHQRSLSKSEIFPLLGLQSFIKRRQAEEFMRAEEAEATTAAAAVAVAAAAAAAADGSVN